MRTSSHGATQVGLATARALLLATVLAGAAGLAWSINGLRESPDWWLGLLVLVAGIVAELLKVTIYEAKRQTFSFSLSVVVIMAAITIEPPLGPTAALITASIHLVATRQRVPQKVAFNIANLVLAATCGSWVYAVLRATESGFGPLHVIAAGCAALVYYLLNAGVVSAMISLHSGRSFHTIMRESAWFAPTSILLGLTGGFVGGVHEILGPLGLVMFMVPVLLMRFTLAFYAGRSAATILHLDQLARRDVLTGLPNRVELQDRLQERLSQGLDQPFALLMMDLDRFKEINDTFGHHHGDMLLQEIGSRLRAVLSETDLAARLGGDEFALMLPGADAADACRTAEGILGMLQTTFIVAGHRLDVGASIGIAVAPDDGADPATLLRCADVAMYTAKRDRSGFALHSPEQDQYTPERLSLVGDLRHAIESGHLTLHFQPKIDLRSRQSVGAEALVRWLHPERGLIPPDNFIPLAEHAGLIKPLTRWVLSAALGEVRGWHDAGWRLSVAVNASAQDLRDPSFPDLVQHLLAERGVPAGSLRIEITESAMMADLAQAREILSRLRSLGVGVSIDDFGTGYSSLAYLKRLPIDELKLDRSFVRHLATDDEDAAIVRAAITLAHDLGLSVVAEGAEDSATVEHLSALGCDQVQGYVFSRPLPSKAFADWMTARSTSPGLLRKAA